MPSMPIEWWHASQTSLEEDADRDADAVGHLLEAHRFRELEERTLGFGDAVRFRVRCRKNEEGAELRQGVVFGIAVLLAQLERARWAGRRECGAD